MSVLIKGMGMPLGGRILIVFPSGRVLEVSADATQDIFRETKAILVPPHGDLVDKQQMTETNEQHYLVCKGEPNADYAREVVLRMLDQAPTIIEAEVEE